MSKVNENKLDKLLVVGDRVLIKPKTMSNRSKGGLFLPPGYKEKEEIRMGYVMKCGPGYPIPLPSENDKEPWESKEKTNYVALQAQEGDLAIFMQKGAIEIVYNNEKYFIVPQHSILLLERDEKLFD
ncbi:MAG: co-chaperone GroES family protein [Bacteroidales bacterium]|nr:co-chaperone GroES family protein [Bacteroidales bacterium]